jgi:hypothetical protein
MTAGTTTDNGACNDTLNAAAMLTAQALAHEVTDGRVIETHISWVLLSGAFAYKIRKPVVLPFLDFSTLDARRTDCEQELRLNRRWAPMLYLGIVPIFGPPNAPSLTVHGAVIDYAVKMRQFADDARLDRVVAEHGLDEHLLRLLAKTTADMHRHAPRADMSSEYGAPATIAAEVRGNITVLRRFARVDDPMQLRTVGEYCTARVARLHEIFSQRRRAGACRECHGDLHLENLALIAGEVVPSDAVEFEPAFRWIDIASDLAFLLMDLHARGFAEQARQVLNEYLQLTGDYALLAVLDHYLCYRAMVRAKIAGIRSTQLGTGPDADAATTQANQLLALAASWCRAKPAPKLIITHGVSGSGKSWLAHRVMGKFDAICIRSDVERKRLYDDQDIGNVDRYGASATQAVYTHLLEQAAHALAAGMNVILDATYLARSERERAARWAADRGVEFRIISLSAPPALLEQRIKERSRLGRDASQADAQVLALQLAGNHDLDASERAVALCVDERGGGDIDAIVRWLNK